jgi:hypothetical protein
LFAGNTITDLGIVFDRELNFHIHSDSIYCKAIKILGFIKRIFSKFKLVIPIKSIYCAFVRSISKYEIQVLLAVKIKLNVFNVNFLTLRHMH